MIAFNTTKYDHDSKRCVAIQSVKENGIEASTGSSNEILKFNDGHYFYFFNVLVTKIRLEPPKNQESPNYPELSEWFKYDGELAGFFKYSSV